MGSRALFAVEDGQTCGYYWLQWGSPSYQVPNLATFIRYCRTRGIPPTVEVFEHFAQIYTDGQLPTEAVPPGWWAEDLTDAENRYQLVIGTGQPVRLLAETRRYPALGPRRWQQMYRTCGDAQLYLAAARARDQMAVEIRRMAARDPDLVGTRWMPVPGLQPVLAEAARFRRWAATAQDTTEDAVDPATAPRLPGGPAGR